MKEASASRVTVSGLARQRGAVVDPVVTVSTLHTSLQAEIERGRTDTPRCP